MKHCPPVLLGLAVVTILVAGAGSAQVATELRLDPLLLVSLKEARNVTMNLGDRLFPGWDFKNTPVLFYRPGVQDVLIGFPHKPQGFSEFTGAHPLGKEMLYVRNGTTFFDIDDQNTTREIEGVSVLVVADTFSRMRNQMRHVLTERPREYAAQWLDDWGFVSSPYDLLRMIFHEGFHVHQKRMAPEKGANEAAVARYPVLDATNNALHALEGRILRDALLTEDPATRLEKIREFVAVRGFRQARLPKEAAAYENLNEYSEGLAKYVEYKFLQQGEGVQPVPEMYYQNGFSGYRGVLVRQFREAIDQVPVIASVSDARFGNRFGTGPLRFRLYELGACQALLLDEVSPDWKQRIFADGVYLSDLLAAAVPLSDDDRGKYLRKAQADYDYERLYRDKVQFESEGKQYAQEKASRILGTAQTLVRVRYAGFSDKAVVARFTPFGVTQVSEQSAVYDMVPILVIFKKGVMLDFKQPIAILLDQANQEVIFAVATPASRFESAPGGKLDISEFTLSHSGIEVTREGNRVSIQLK